MEEQLLKVAGGLGVFVYSLKLITGAFDDTVSDGIRNWIEKISSRSYYCVLIGILVTAIFHASSTAILLTMGLLNKSLISLPQAGLIVLGAALGTTLKMWGYWDFSLITGFLLIIFSSVGLLLRWQRDRIRVLEITLGIGFTILGLQLVTTGLEPMLRADWMMKLISACRGSTFSEALIASVSGAIAALLVQSSSAVVLLTLEFATQGFISFEGAAAIILGANIGTTSTALLLSIGQSISAKRLAFMHFAAKGLGVLMTLLFFRTFLSVIAFLLPEGSSISTKLALVHTGFNFLDLFFWWAFLPVLVRFSRAVFSDAYDSEYWLSVLGVQRLLSRMPERAILESRQELQKIVRGLSELTRSGFELISDVQLKIETREKLLKNLSGNLQTYEKRLHDLEQVLGRVAARFEGRKKLRKELFFVLERQYQLQRTMLVFKNWAQILDAQTLISDMSSEQTQSFIRDQFQKIMNSWDLLYQSLSEEEQSFQSIAETQGAFICYSFFEGQNFRNGLKMQKLYMAWMNLERELKAAQAYEVQQPFDNCIQTSYLSPA